MLRRTFGPAAAFLAGGVLVLSALPALAEDQPKPPEQGQAEQKQPEKS